MTSLALLRPFCFEVELSSLRLDCVERGIQGIIQHGFHASEDSDEVRQHVFKAIHNGLHQVIRLDRVLIRKGEMKPEMRMPEKFYSETMGFLVGQVLQRLQLHDFSQVLVVTDSLPPGKRGGGIERAIRHVLKSVMPQSTLYRVLHCPASEWYGLQVADYLNWAFFRRWERRDPRWDNKRPINFTDYIVAENKEELREKEP